MIPGLRIYTASSWRNPYYNDVVSMLRMEFEVYDFRTVANAFQWTQIDDGWQLWHTDEFKKALHNPIAVKGFDADFEGMKHAHVAVLVLPCGRSAHWEAGWFTGKGKPVYVYIPEKIEPELTYSLAKGIYSDIGELVIALKLEEAEYLDMFATG